MGGYGAWPQGLTLGFCCPSNVHVQSPGALLGKILDLTRR